MKPLIWIEGVIGCGKTTFAREVAKRLGLLLLEEPVATNPYLEPFYKDPPRYAFGFQMRMLGQRYLMQRTAACVSAGALPQYNGAILDRSIAGDRVFCKLHNEAGNINDLDWRTYEELYEIMCNTLLPPTLLVYLDAQPKTAYERMCKRARKAEAGVPLEYLEQLRDGYAVLLEEARRGLRPWGHAVNVMRLIWDPVSAEPDWEAVTATVQDACASLR